MVTRSNRTRPVPFFFYWTNQRLAVCHMTCVFECVCVNAAVFVVLQTQTCRCVVIKMKIFMCGCDVVTETVQQVELFVCSRGLIGKLLHADVICFLGLFFFPTLILVLVSLPLWPNTTCRVFVFCL